MIARIFPALALSLLLGALTVLAGCGSGGGASGHEAPPPFDAKRAFSDLRAQVALGPRPSGSPAGRREVALIRSRLRGTSARDVRVQRPLRNVIATIPGRTSRTVVLAAHWDTKDGIPGFVGANDGASGVAVLLELARSLPAKLDGPSVQLVFFDGEEARGNRSFRADGTRGSRQYVRYARKGGRQGSLPLHRIKVMVLLDMVGDCDLQIPFEVDSNESVYRAVASAALRIGDDKTFTGTDENGVLDDQIPFGRAGVPALDLIDFDYGPGPSPGAYWHTPQDTLDHVCPASLGKVGRAVAAVLPEFG